MSKKARKIPSKTDLSSREFQNFQFEFEQKKKTAGIAYFLWLFFYPLGAHELYLDDPRFGYRIIAIVLGLCSLGLSLSPEMNVEEPELVTFAMLAFVFVCLYIICKNFFDLFTIPSQVIARNKKIEEKILAEMKSLKK